MEVVSLSSTNYIGLTSNYTFDSTLKVDQDLYYTEDGLEIPIPRAFANLSDNAINNFSNVFLTNKQPLTSALYIQDLSSIRDQGFSSYLATNASIRITDSSRFLVVQEPGIEANTASCAMTGTFFNLDNRYMFDIQFLSDKLCKISHENENITRYLTLDYLGGLVFAKDAKTDYLYDLSPQIFYYVYDRATDSIVFLKNVNDVVKYIIYSGDTQNVALGDPLTAADVPYVSRAIFKCIPRNEAPNNTKLFDPWVSYSKNFKINTQDINENRSYNIVNQNLLVHNEFYSTTGVDMPVNILSLKNTNTPENFHTRGNPFQSQRSELFDEIDVDMRSYKKLFTGSNQKYGNDNITIGYEAYSTNITLKKDKVTYFHIPQNFYPFIQLNINDSGLTESGAIAGDHPLKSDKIFKKLSTFKNTSPFGEVKDEATGYFLCSWLSGNWDINIKPVWVDRYYNPSQISFLAALSTAPFQALKYITLSDCLFAEVEDILGKVDVFDKPSDLIFEPGVYYAYHHYGPSDVQKYIDSLSVYSVQKDFGKYFNLLDLPAEPNNARPEEYRFNGDTYAVSESLSAIQNSGQFTMSFWAGSDDWTIPFGDQVIGNYANDGFGIFNQNVTTPTLYVNSATGVSVFNTDLKRLKSLSFNKDISAVIRLDNITNYYIIFKDGEIKQFNSADSDIKSVPTSELAYYINHDHTTETIYALCTGGDPLSRYVMQIDLPRVTVFNATTLLFNNQQIRCATDSSAGWPAAQSQEIKFNKARSIDYYKGKLYFTPGTKTQRVDDTIFYLRNNNIIARWDNIESATVQPATTAFQSQTQIEDFGIDFDNNLWILNNDRTFLKFTLNRQFLLSGETTDTRFKNHKIGFIADFFEGSYTKQMLLTQQGQIVLERNPYSITTYDLAASNEYYNTSAIAASYFSSSSSLSSLYIDGIQLSQNISTNAYYDILTFRPAFSAYFEQLPYPNIMITGYTETLEADIYQTLSGTGYLFSIYDSNGALAQQTALISVTGFNLEPTNYDYLRKIVGVKYPEANLNIKTTMVNIYDRNQTETVDIPFSLSAVDPGFHHFAIRVDTYHGYITVFLDGQVLQIKRFKPRKYQFNDFSNRPFLAGTSNYANSIPLFKFLKKNASVVTGLTIKDFRLYNYAIKDTDIQMLARENMIIRDIEFTLPCGRRNYVEEIERYFKASTPGSKSTLFNIVIKNSGITDQGLRNTIETRIISRLRQLAPVYSKLNKIKWVN